MASTPATYGNDASTPRFSVARYQKMIEKGILTGEDRVELLEGYIVLRLPRTPQHDCVVSLVMRRLLAIPLDCWLVRILSSIALHDSQPEPDFTVARGDERAFLERHPGSVDVGMLIEVADSSLLRDQRDKTRIYARANIPIYWIINLVDSRVEVFSQPSGPTAVPAYGTFQTYQPGDDIPLILDGVTVATVPVSDLLP